MVDHLPTQVGIVDRFTRWQLQGTQGDTGSQRLGLHPASVQVITRGDVPMQMNGVGADCGTEWVGLSNP